jgi:hypothetical protein
MFTAVLRRMAIIATVDRHIRGHETYVSLHGAYGNDRVIKESVFCLPSTVYPPLV